MACKPLLLASACLPHWSHCKPRLFIVYFLSCRMCPPFISSFCVFLITWVSVQMSSFHNGFADYSLDSSHSLKLPLPTLKTFVSLSFPHTIPPLPLDGRDLVYCSLLDPMALNSAGSELLFVRGVLSYCKHTDGGKLGLEAALFTEGKDVGWVGKMKRPLHTCMSTKILPYNTVFTLYTDPLTSPPFLLW